MRMVLVLLVTLLGLSVVAAPAAAAPKKDVGGAGGKGGTGGGSSVLVETTDLDRLVDDFVASLPGRDSEAYDVPTSTEAATMADAYGAIAEGRLTEAANLADPMSYDVVDLTDSATGDRFVMLRERTGRKGTRTHNWGLYIHRVASPSPVLVEVTHPRFDINSHLVGREVFRLAGARTLFVSGAHRYANADGSADVAHRADSVFHAVHLAATGTGDVVYQPHGFSETKHPHLGDLVVSGGVAPAPALVSQLATGLTDPYIVCLYDGTDCTEFGATTNVQGASTRAAGATFVHVEHARWIRDSAADRSEVARRTAGVLAS